MNDMTNRHCWPHGQPVVAGFWWTCLLAVLGPLLMTVPAWSASDIGFMTPEMVFKPQARPHVWTQVFTPLYNRTNDDLLVDLVSKIKDPQLGEVRFSRRLWLPKHSTALACMAIRPGSLTPEMTGNTRGRLSQMAYDLVDAKTGRILSREPNIPVEPLASDTRLAVIVDDDPQRELAGSIDDKAKQALGFSDLLASSASHLPDCWYGYSSANVVLVGQLDLDAHRPAQSQALLDWITIGGVAVVFANPRMQDMMTSPLGQAAGVAMASSAIVTEIVIPAADAASQPEKVNFARPMQLLNLAVQGAEVRFAAVDGTPLMTHARLGLGHIFVVALPSAALAEAGLQPLWADIGATMRTPSAIRMDAVEPASLASLQGLAGRRGVARWVILCWLGAFVLVTAGVGLAMRLRSRGELTWLVMLPLAILLSIGLYSWSLARQGNATSVTFVGASIGDGQGQAVVSQTFSYYSPKAQNLDFQSGSPLGRIIPAGRQSGGTFAHSGEQTSDNPSGDAFSLTNVRSAGGLMLPEFEIPPGAAMAFSNAASVSLGGRLISDLRFGPKGLEGTITNNTRFGLADAVVFARGRAYRIGDLPAGKATPVVIGNDDRMDSGEFLRGTAVKSYEGLLRNGLVTQLTALQTGARRDKQPYLLAWSKTSPLAPPEMDGADSAGLMLMVEPLAYSPSPAGSRVLIPEDMLLKRYAGRGMTPINIRTEEFLAGLRTGAGVDLALSPPPAVGPLTQTRLTLRVAIQAPTYQMIISGITPDGELLQLETFDNPSGIRDFVVTDADRFMTVQGAVRVNVQVQPLQGGDDAASAAARPAWRFDSIDSTLEGTVK